MTAAVLALVSDIREPREPEFFERDGKRFKMWDPSDQDPRGAAYIPVNELVLGCPECRTIGGLPV